MSSTSKWRTAGVATALCFSLGLSSSALADDSVAEARETVTVFKKADPSIERFFKAAAGYVVFPTVDKGAFIVGGAGGSGVLFKHGKPVGTSSIGQVTAGFQVGGQAYSEIIFFENGAGLSEFMKGNFSLSAQASAVALSAGAAANAKYRSGVAVFTATKTGLMVEASVGGQWFHYTPFPICAPSTRPTGLPAAAGESGPAGADKPASPDSPPYCSPGS